MKEKFQSLKKLDVGTIISQPEQKNVLGGYSGTTNVYCYHNNTYLGWTYIGYGWNISPRTACINSGYTTTNRTVTYYEP